jgi:hypothetical protein
MPTIKRAPGNGGSLFTSSGQARPEVDTTRWLELNGLSVKPLVEGLTEGQASIHNLRCSKPPSAPAEPFVDSFVTMNNGKVCGSPPGLDNSLLHDVNMTMHMMRCSSYECLPCGP